MIFLGLDQHQAEATSLLAIVPVAIVGTYAPGPLRQRAPRTTRCCSALLSLAGAAGGRGARQRAVRARSCATPSPC